MWCLQCWKLRVASGTTGLVGPPLRDGPLDDRLDSEQNHAEYGPIVPVRCSGVSHSGSLRLRNIALGTSQHLVNNINFFGRLGGFEIATKWLEVESASPTTAPLHSSLDMQPQLAVRVV